MMKAKKFESKSPERKLKDIERVEEMQQKNAYEGDKGGRS